MSQNFVVSRADLRDAKLAPAAPLEPAEGEVVLEIERFALTANNISYGMAGDMLGYWSFFPADDGFGRIPAWGIARVTKSAHAGVKVGDTFFGYVPMSNEVLMTPVDVSSRGFSDGAAHRAQLPAIYQEYLAVTPANGFDGKTDDLQCILRILFVTSMHMDDHFAANDFFGASTLIIGSASSKTGYGLAYLASKRPGIKVVGLTSPSNKAFVEGLGIYDTVLAYDEVEKLNQSEPSVYVDMSGNRDVLTRIHTHLGDALKNSTGVGATHWDAPRDDAAELPGPTPDFFFVPTHMVEHRERDGLAGHDARIVEGSTAFYGAAKNWIDIQMHAFADMSDTYASLLKGVSPKDGHIVVAG
ncbi:DUF2855 family protein [Pyruvatibacter sp. HU-CL02332]|uniref:DUF2855 family protein n=1 Tax=Pyruvatibacter sp. HU-CL02332 TaxID=3127650 RepID=UPI00310B1ABC